MDKIRIRKLIGSLAKRDYRRMYMNDFFLTWEKSDDEIAARMAAQQHFRPAARDRRIPASLRAYAKLVSSADKGAVRIVEEE